MVFRGTASQVRDAPNSQIITFDVTRVWKGDVKKREVLYNPLLNFDDDTPLVEHVEYFVVASHLEPTSRAKIGIPPEAPPVLAASCATQPFSPERDAEGAAGGYAPR